MVLQLNWLIFVFFFYFYIISLLYLLHVNSFFYIFLCFYPDTLTKSLELYRNLYYNEGDRSKEVIWYTMLTSRTFTELYELARQVLGEDKVQRLMEAVINMSKDGFIIHEWQKEKMDALVKLNEMEGAKEEGRSLGIEERTIEIAKNMLNKKMNIKDISEITGLTIREIEKLQSTED